MNKFKDFLIDNVVKTVVGFTVCVALVLPCACAESIVGESSDYTTTKVLYLGDDIATDAEGTFYTVKSTEYKYGDIISITLNPHGKVVGINGRCLIQTLD